MRRVHVKPADAKGKFLYRERIMMVFVPEYITSTISIGANAGKFSKLLTYANCRMVRRMIKCVVDEENEAT
jgi:hypothetical protein